MKQIKLSITEDYVSHWSWWQGVRELMQNAIDTGDFDILFDYHNGSMEIISRGGSIPTRALLLGATTKRDDDSTIGKFGEGMKLGFLVLIREGANIAMENGNDLWVPEIIHDESMDANVLVVNIAEGVLDESDPSVVKIKIHGIPQADLDEIMSNYAPTTEREIIIENSRGKAYSKLNNSHKDCCLFVNGLFVTRVQGKFKFDYDFKPSAFVLDRDRDSANTYEVKHEANRLLSDSDDIDLLANLALESYDDLALFNGRTLPSSNGYYFNSRRDSSDEEKLADRAIELFEEKYGEDAFPISDTWTDGKKRVVTQMAVSRGYTPVTVKDSVYKMVNKQYQIDSAVDAVLSFKPLEYLEGFLKKHDRRLRAKPRKDLEKTIQLLRIAAGKE